MVDNAKSKVSKEYEAIISLFKDLKAEHQNPGKDMKKILDDLQDGFNRVGKALDDLRNDLAASKVEISSNMDQAKAKALCQCCTRKHIKCWKNLSTCCCHMKSWQIPCPGTHCPNTRSLTG